MIFIDVTSNVKVGEALCAGPSRWLRASSCFFSFSGGGNGPNGALNGESSLNGKLRFHEQFWQRQDTCDCGYEIRCFHHLFIVEKTMQIRSAI